MYSLIFEYCRHTQQVQLPLLTQVGLVSLTFTASSEVSPISTASLAAALISLFLSLLAPTPLLRPWWPLPTALGVLFFDIHSYKMFSTLVTSQVRLSSMPSSSFTYTCNDNPFQKSLCSCTDPSSILEALTIW